MEDTTRDQAAFHIYFTLFARDKELNIAAEGPLIDDARLLWSEHGKRRRPDQHRLKPAAGTQCCGVIEWEKHSNDLNPSFFFV